MSAYLACCVAYSSQLLASPSLDVSVQSSTCRSLFTAPVQSVCKACRTPRLGESDPSTGVQAVLSQRRRRRHHVAAVFSARRVESLKFIVLIDRVYVILSLFTQIANAEIGMSNVCITLTHSHMCMLFFMPVYFYYIVLEVCIELFSIPCFNLLYLGMWLVFLQLHCTNARLLVP